MRYIQEDNRKTPVKEINPTPKFGGKAGQKDYSKLSEVKKIPTKDGYK